MKEEIIETDVLCVGGGIAGLMAGIRASEVGARVTIAEKGNVLYSGAGGAGNDHFWCYIPEVHGADIKPIVERARHSQQPGLGSTAFLYAWYEKSFDIVKLWDSWGIPMKYLGKWEFAGHGYAGGPPLISLKYGGRNQKKILTTQALKRNVQIRNRVMVFDLLLNGNSQLIGAIGIDTRENTLIIFQAKTVILGTGRMVRLYPSTTPAWLANVISPFNLTGDGRIMAYRAGAELVNMEMPYRHSGIKYFSRGGQATWVGVVRDPQGKAIGPYVTKPERKYCDFVAESNKTLFDEYYKSGKGPVYMDCRGISDEDHDYMIHWLENEGNAAVLNHLREEGVDLRKNPLEFMTSDTRVWGGVAYNEKAETSVKGLYAAGDESQGGISAAATFGWFAGENAAKYAKEVPSANIEQARVDIEQGKNLIAEISNRKNGHDWDEVNIALQQIMADYAGEVRSETMLSAGYNHLQRLKQKAYTAMKAGNQHELVHCMEVLNLIDSGELVFVTSNERKETRGSFVRSDYPITNPRLDKLLIVKKVNSKPVMEWRDRT